MFSEQWFLRIQFVSTCLLSVLLARHSADELPTKHSLTLNIQFGCIVNLKPRILKQACGTCKYTVTV